MASAEEESEGQLMSHSVAIPCLPQTLPGLNRSESGAQLYQDQGPAPSPGWGRCL